MKRREFIETAGVISSAALIPLRSRWNSAIAAEGFEMGYQLYSIRDAMAIDPLKTLTDLKGMGYTHFEIYGYQDKEDKIYGYRSTELRKVVDDLDVKITSGHYGFAPYLEKSDDELRRFVDRCMICADNLGSKYITWPWIAPEQRNMETYKRMIDKLNVVGDHLSDSAFEFTYHNHGFEFERHDGTSCYDLILKRTDANLVKLQMDMYWVMHSADITPKLLVENNPGRFVMWHLKDMDAASRDYTELGNGSINYLNLLPDPVDSGLEYYYIEQGGNFAIDSTHSARSSALYFQDYLKKLI